jgi:hypothetical protein
MRCWIARSLAQIQKLSPTFRVARDTPSTLGLTVLNNPKVRSMSTSLGSYGNVATSFPANPRIEIILLVLQVFQVLFLWFHDWIPLGRLNDVTSVRGRIRRRALSS